MTQQVKQRRAFTHQPITIVKDTCESAVIDAREWACISLSIPGAWTAAGIGLKVSPVPNTTFKPLYRTTVKTGSPIKVQVTSVAVGNAYIVYPAVACVGYIRLWSMDNAGADVNQGADRVIGVSLKG